MIKGDATWVVIAVVVVAALLVVLSLHPKIAVSFEDFCRFAHIWLAHIALVIIFIVELHDVIAKGQKDKVFKAILKSLWQYLVIQGFIYVIEIILTALAYLKHIMPKPPTTEGHYSIQ